MSSKKETAESRARRLEKKRQYYLANKEKYKLWGIASRQRPHVLEKARERSRNYQRENYAKLRPAKNVWAANNKHKSREYDKSPIRRSKARANAKKHYESNAQFVFRKRLRGKMRTFLAAKYPERCKIKSHIGCSRDELLRHIEKQFLPGMSWEARNFHLDHIRPCCAFDLSKIEEQMACFHFTNLRPLWPVDNQSKGGRMPPANEVPHV